MLHTGFFVLSFLRRGNLRWPFCTWKTPSLSVGPYLTISTFPVIDGLYSPFFCFWRSRPQWAMTSSFTRFLEHTQRRTTVGRLLWTSDQLMTETSTWQNSTLRTEKHARTWWDSNPQSQQASGRRPTH